MGVRNWKILLASASPRRKEILSMAGFEFRVKPVYVEEVVLSSPIDTALENSRRKVLAVKEFLRKGEVALAADTVVVLGNKILGKPKDSEEAVEFLKQLSGRWHTVVTAFSILSPSGYLLSDYEESRVKFKRLSTEEIEWYVSTGEPLDKAGAYGIQGIGALFIERIEGDFYNVMGLPVGRIYDILIMEFQL